MASSLPYTTGTVTLTNGSDAIVGNGTGWLINGVRGGLMTVEVAGANTLVLASVDGEEAATAATKWLGPSGTYAYAISMASADAADTIWASRHWARVVGQALLAGIVPVASGTLAERDALDPQPATGEWFARAEPPYDLEFYRKVSAGWDGPYQFRGEASTVPGPAGDGFNPAGAWVIGSTYDKNDMVSHGGRSFVSFADGNVGNEPPDADEDDAYWQYVPAAVGPPNTLAIGTVDVGPADASITGAAPNQTLNLTIPQGPAGSAASIAVGTVTTVNPGDPATVTNVGTSAAAVFDFEIPKGQDGTGTGDVVGPASATDGHVAVFDGTTGKLIRSTGRAPFSGDYGDLSNKPTLGSAAAEDASAFATAEQGGKADTAVQPDALGTAAALDAGTSDGNVVVVQSGGKLPALDGSDLTNLPGGGGWTWSSSQSLSGLGAVDFTGIPATALEIILAIDGSSLSGTDGTLVQLGVSGTPVTSGYAATAAVVVTASSSAQTSSAGFPIMSNVAAAVNTGRMHLLRATGNTWLASYSGHYVNGAVIGTVIAGGRVALGGVADMVRLTRSGSDTFDLGSAMVGWR